MFFCKVHFKLRPRLARHWLLLPPATRIGKVARGKDYSVHCSEKLLRRVQDLSGVGKVHSCLNLFGDRLERLVDIVRRIHARHVDIEVGRGDLVIFCLDVINHLQAS